jgi:hypothetical protein
MGGGLMQLVAYGAQDIYLTGNPQITFFKVVYRRHTNFSMESIEQTINGTVGFGNDVTSTISRNGDLVSRLYVEFNPLNIFAGSSTADTLGANIGHALLKEVEIEIGGQRIDRHYSHWLTTWTDLTEENPTGVSNKITVDTGAEPTTSCTLFQKLSYNHKGIDNNTGLTGAGAPSRCFVPLQFWFCRNPGLALPLIALQYHEVKIKIKVGLAADIAETPGGLTDSHSDFKLFADYIYLDTDERRRFAQVSHEYLIEQLQFDSESSVAATSKTLNFNHPVKELIFTGRPTAAVSVDTKGEVGGASTPGTIVDGDTFQLKLNGHDRFAARNRNYFTRTQIWQHHTGFGGVVQKDSIGVYSFALKPEEHQPSGTCNFSRIDNAEFIFPAQTAGDTTSVQRAGGLNIYAINYNVLRIMSGMGGLAYSN